MAKMLKFVLLVLVDSYCRVQCVPPSPTSAVTDMLQGEFATLKNTMKVLSDQWEKWNTLFLTSLEPRITSTASTLASIDSNIHNLQERAHVWDTFQLHVSAWNDQLASMDRKIDIISKGQEKVLSLDGKINAILTMEYKLDNSIKILNNLYDSVTNLDSTVHARKIHDILFSEFATRGVLSSIKMIEKKLDRLLIAGQHSLSNRGPDDKPKLTIKCNTPKIVEDLLNDISSKVDVIFDTVSNSSEEDNDDYENYDYSNDSGKSLQKAADKSCAPFKRANLALEEILNRAIRIENVSLILLDKEMTHFERLSAAFSDKSETDRVLEKIVTTSNLDGYFSEQRSHFENAIDKWNRNYCDEKPTPTPTPLFDSTSTGTVTDDVQPTWIPIVNRNKSSCEDLEYDASSGAHWSIFPKTWQKSYTQDNKTI